MRRFFFLNILIILTRFTSYAQDASELAQSHDLLTKARSQCRELKKQEDRISRFMDLGLWKEAEAAIKLERPGHETSLLRARYLMLQYRFTEASILVNDVLSHSHSNQTALLLKTELLMQAWSLPAAIETAADLLRRNDKNMQAAEDLGMISLLQKNYSKALVQAHDLETKFPQQGEGFLLEARILYTSALGEGALPLLKKAVQLSPLNSEVRFLYGYSLWRGGRTADLALMQAEWNFALELNPMNYLVHWHLGNGYTASTYKDYEAYYTPQIVESLKEFDPMIMAGNLNGAIRLAQQVIHTSPEAVLPLVYEGSALYMAGLQKGTDAAKALDSADAVFKTALTRAPGFGPAHNGLASVINARRLSWLSFADSVDLALNKTEVSRAEDFNAVFSTLSYYPGKQVKAMVWNELHSARAYLPLLKIAGKHFIIPALHQTLAESMHSSFFNLASTFDNRRWMDIRGVGSGAASIEYVLAGAFHERNVLLHEFTHLFHHEVLTDNQKRRIRSLYYAAVKNKRTLDYYAAGNEDEYFAQIYEAYFDAFKVHPLDYKSMNTSGELKLKDPQAFAFVDSLSKSEFLFLTGKQQVLKDNYAQVYSTMIGEELDKPVPNPAHIQELLRGGASWNPEYMPLILSRATLAIQQKDFTNAETILRNAELKRPDFAPVYVLNSTLNKALVQEGLLEQAPAFDLRNSYLLKALSVEKDLQLSSELQNNYVDFLIASSKYSLALNAANEYIAHASLVSSYLREQKDEIKAKTDWIRALMGYPEGLNTLLAEAEKNPGNSGYLLMAAEALDANKMTTRAAELLRPFISRQGEADGPVTQHYIVYLAEAGNMAEAAKMMKSTAVPADSTVWYGKALLASGSVQAALRYLTATRLPSEPKDRALLYQTLATAFLATSNEKAAMKNYLLALENNPFDLRSAAALAALYAKEGKNAEASQVTGHLKDLGIKPGENAPH